MFTGSHLEFRTADRAWLPETSIVLEQIFAVQLQHERAIALDGQPVFA